MLPDNIDDLFRQQLDGHATPPAPDLWVRLQLPASGTDPVDAAFQEGLRGHATPPRRELWERLEDEHLRPQPRRRRVGAWWQLSVAAVLLLGLLLGGGLLWRGRYPSTSGDGLAQQPTGAARPGASQPVAATAGTAILTQPQQDAQSHEVAATSSPLSEASEKKQEKFSTRATAAHPSTSSTPIATTTRPRRPATAAQAAGSQQPHRQQPDAATGSLASTGERKTPAGQLPSTPAVTPSPAVAPATQPAEQVPVVAAATPPSLAPEIIEVEVRRGSGPARPAASTVAAAETPVAPARRRGLRLGSLLRQADHLVHGEPVSLAEATGLPETLTVQTRLGGRLISKTIQL